MNARTFELVVQRQARQARDAPLRFKIKLLLLALGGYAFLLALLLLALSIAAGLIYTLTKHPGGAFGLIKLAIIPLTLSALLMKALWVRFPPPEGRRLKRAEAPRLFKEIRAIRRQLKSPPIHVVLLNDESNAAALQVPRLGFFSWSRNYLIIGLPFLMLVEPDQLRAAIAHELGHHSRRQSGLHNWIVKVDSTWNNALKILEKERRRSAVVIRKFFEFYIPILNANILVLRRENEMGADRASTEIANADTAARTLVGHIIRTRVLLNHYWDQLGKSVEGNAEPPDNPYRELRDLLKAAVPEEEANAVIAAELDRETEAWDFHPSLFERLRQLGWVTEHQAEYDIEIPVDEMIAPLSNTAAEEYLGDSLESLIDEFGSQWRQRVLPSWEQRHAYATAAQEKLASIESLDLEELSSDELLDLGICAEEFRSTEEALPLLARAVAMDANNAAAQYHLGRVKLGHEDEQGLYHLEEAMHLDRGAVQPACEVIHRYLVSAGRNDEAAAYADRWQEEQQFIEAVAAERQGITRKDKFEPARMPAIHVQKIVKQLKREPQVKRAYLVAKKVEHLQDHPVFVLAIKPPTIVDRNKLRDELAEKLDLPAVKFLFIMGKHRDLDSRIRRVEDSRII